jgi:hypothetical protein
MEKSENRIEEQPETVYMLRFSDAGDPVTIVREIGPKSYEMNRTTNFREKCGTKVTINPKLTENLPTGSLLNLGVGQTFLVVEPKKSAMAGSFGKSIYVRRIPLETTNKDGEVIEGFDQIKADYESKGKGRLVYEIGSGNVPLDDRTRHLLQRDNLQ